MIAPAAGALLAETRRRPGRLLLTGLAVVVATVFAAGTVLFTETLRGYVTDVAARTPPGAAAVVDPDAFGSGSDDAAASALLDRIRDVDGVADAQPVRNAYSSVGGPVGGIWAVVSDPMGGALSRLDGPALRGRLPGGPAEVAIGEATADRTGIGPGQSLTLTTDDGTRRPVTITGVVPSRADVTNTLFATPDATAGLGGFLDQIDVSAVPGVDAAVLARRIGDALGEPDSVSTGADARVAEVRAASESVDAVLVGLGVFAGLAVVAAAVVVASTFRIVLTQRRTQLALLRCVGARRGQVIGAILAEALVSGLVAGLLGVGLAVLAGYGVLAALPAAGVTDVPALVLWWPGLGAALLVAVLSTVVAALAPALAAARIPPVAALGAAGAGESGSPRSGRRMVLAGLLAAVAVGSGGIAVAVGDSAELAVLAVAASGMVAFAAIVAAGPVLVRGLAATAGRLISRLGGAPGRLATANAGQVPRRTAATISVLTLGVGLTAALLVALASTEADAQASLAEQFPTDVVLTTLDGAGSPAVAAALADDPRVVTSGDEGALFVDPAPGRSEAEGRAAVDEAVAGRPEVLVQYAGDARAELSSTIGTARLVGLGLVGMTALVAVVGVGVTLMLSVTERTRETGLLRSIGLTRRGVRAMVAWEAALSGAGAAIIGAVVGAGYGVLGAQVLGVGTGLAPASVPTLAGPVVGVVAVAVLAAVIPAVRAGRVPPIRALQEA